MEELDSQGQLNKWQGEGPGVAEALQTMGQYLIITTRVGAISVRYTNIQGHNA